MTSFIARLLAITAFGLIFCGALTAQSMLSIEVSSPTEASIFEFDADRMRVITDAESLELRGKVDDPFLDFLLLNRDGREFVQYPRNQEFVMTLPLEVGINTLDARGVDGTQYMQRMELIRLNPYRLVRAAHVPVGGEPQWVDELDIDEELVTHVPQIDLVFDSAFPENVQLRVADAQGNVLHPVSRSNQKIISYPLSEGENVISFQSVFGDKVFQESEWVVYLAPVVSVSPEQVMLSEVWLSRQGDEQPWYTPLGEIPLEGWIDGIHTGSLTLQVGQQSVDVAVAQHEFSAVVPLAEGSLNTVRLSARVGEREFSDLMEIEHRPYVIDWQGIRFGALSNGRMEVAGPVEGNRASGYRTRSPVVFLEGRSSYPHSIPGSLHNRTTRQEFEVTGSPQNLRSRIRLNPGENRIQYILSTNDQSLIVDDLVVWFDEPILVERVSGNAPLDNAVQLETPYLTVSGRVPSVQDGILSLFSDRFEKELVVSNGRFSTETPIMIDPGSEFDVQLSVSIQDDSYGTRLFITTTDFDPDQVAPPPDSGLATIPVIEDDAAATAEADRRPVIVEPVPQRVLEPNLVRDPVSNALIRGSVTLQFLIDARGRVLRSSIDVIDSSNPLLNREAVQTMARWTFTPATVDGVPTNRLTRITLIWR